MSSTFSCHSFTAKSFDDHIVGKRRSAYLSLCEGGGRAKTRPAVTRDQSPAAHVPDVPGDWVKTTNLVHTD